MSNRSFPLLAAPWHSAVVVGMLLMPVIWQILSGNLPGITAGTGAANAPFKFYAISIAANIGLAYFCWAGVHWNGGKLSDIVGPLRFSKSGLVRDLPIAAGFFVIWEIVARSSAYFVGPNPSACSIRALLPQGYLEIAMWIAVSITAGVCEELIFRGYLQRQLSAITGRTWLAIALQAGLFDTVHAYKGWRQVVVIFPLGILYGILAARRKDLRVNMMVHAWTDIYEGWLRMI